MWRHSKSREIQNLKWLIFFKNTFKMLSLFFFQPSFSSDYIYFRQENILLFLPNSGDSRAEDRQLSSPRVHVATVRRWPDSARQLDASISQWSIACQLQQCSTTNKLTLLGRSCVPQHGAVNSLWIHWHVLFAFSAKKKTHKRMLQMKITLKNKTWRKPHFSNIYWTWCIRDFPSKFPFGQKQKKFNFL